MRIKNQIKIITFITAVICIVYPFSPAYAYVQDGLEVVPASPVAHLTFDEFVASVSNGKSGIITGVYAPGVFAWPVVQQPAGNEAFVSKGTGEVTQFHMAASYGVYGFLAHNYLTGESFYDLSAEQKIILVFGDGSVEYYEINSVRAFRALSPHSPYSSLVDLNDGHTYSVDEIFLWAYTGSNHITFQTCISKDGNTSWGRFFVTAVPISTASDLPLH